MFTSPLILVLLPMSIGKSSGEFDRKRYQQNRRIFGKDAETVGTKSKHQGEIFHALSKKDSESAASDFDLSRFPVTKSRNSVGFTRLLAIGNGWNQSCPFYQFDLLNNNNRSEFLIETNDVVALEYEPSLRRIYWSNSSNLVPEESGIFYSSIDNIETRTLVTGFAAMSLAVDAEEGVVFFIEQHYRKVFSLPLNGDATEESLVKDLSEHTFLTLTMAIHRSKRLIFVCGTRVLIKLDYSGMDSEVVDRGQLIIACSVDPYRDILYYSDDNAIKALDINSGEISGVFNIIQRIWKMQNWNDVLYLSFIDDDAVKSYNIVTNEIRRIGSVPSDRPSFCLLP